MTSPANALRFRLCWLAVGAAAVVLASFLWQGRTGFNAWDEGFLWYGAQRVVAGEVPIRDFMSYDPGRYYWSAAFMALRGDDGIMALRGAVAVFQALGLAAGLGVIATAVPLARRWTWPVLAMLSLVVWMYPRHKLFDIAISIELVAVLAALAARPTVKRHFLAGVAVGLAAVFGRNHGVYGLAGSMVALAAIWRLGPERTTPVRSWLAWSGGVVAGFSPVLLMMAVVPGFAASFRESVAYLFEVKTTNLPLPVPWPWTVPVRRFDAFELGRRWLVGGWFVFLLVFAAGGLGWLAWRVWRRKPVAPALLACVALGMPYAHYAFSRADVGHLAQGVFPGLIGLWVWAGGRKPVFAGVAAVLLLAGSVWTMAPAQPGVARLRATKAWSERVVGSDRLRVDDAGAAELDRLQRLVERYAPHGESFVATPFWPGAYAVIHRKSPMWEIYALYPKSDAFQRAEIARIEAAKPAFVVVQDLALDGREELRFRHTHPMIDQYVRDHFRLVPARDLPRSLQLYVDPAVK